MLKYKSEIGPLHFKHMNKTIAAWPKWKREIISNKPPRRRTQGNKWEVISGDVVRLSAKVWFQLPNETQAKRLCSILNRLKKNARKG